MSAAVPPRLRRVIRRWKSRSERETLRIGERFAGALSSGDVVALIGPLGAGKTVFVRGAARGLGLRRPGAVSSPTFVLIHEYRARLPIFHMDWYRLPRLGAADEEMAMECFESRGVTFVEWADRDPEALPKAHWKIVIRYAAGGQRSIEARPPKAGRGAAS